MRPTLLLLRRRIRLETTTPGRFHETQRRQQEMWNRGELTAKDAGGSFTRPGIYKNTRNPVVMASYMKKESEMRSDQGKNRLAGGVSDDRVRALETGASPLSAEERAVRGAMDADALQFGAKATETARRGPNVAGQYTSRLHRTLHKESEFERTERVLAANDITPTETEFKRLMRRIAAVDEDDGIVDRMHERLVEDAGVYSAQRLDAYMLGDESAFPAWVNRLNTSVRDRVKYGSLGLTEEDEALRVRLLRLPLDRRRVEWGRLKAARHYAAGIEEQKLSPHEVREARLARRHFHALRRKRELRASIMRRIALKKPEYTQVFPTHHVDFSARLATVAQFVENGIATQGQWPLDAGVLHRGKIKRDQEQAERLFLKSADEKKALRRGHLVEPDVASALRTLDPEELRSKRLSRKEYAIRVNNIVHGVEDDRGRKPQHIRRIASSQRQVGESDVAVSLRREVENDPRPNMRGSARQSPTRNWKTKESPFSGFSSAGRPGSN